ncbi:carboxymuconolactone decarboxylase family protein [Streptomyces mirabilis]|uniref:carboxymuconolactone decarboxylase family protein n=1 Tax=Streptomyces mirabilis TaxID=68239 RepID=UPI0036875FFA
MGHHVTAYVFGDIYGRGGLDVRRRRLVTITILTAWGGAETQLKWHAAAVLNVGLTPTEIIESLIQGSAY